MSAEFNIPPDLGAEEISTIAGRFGQFACMRELGRHYEEHAFGHISIRGLSLSLQDRDVIPRPIHEANDVETIALRLCQQAYYDSVNFRDEMYAALQPREIGQLQLPEGLEIVEATEDALFQPYDAMHHMGFAVDTEANAEYAFEHGVEPALDLLATYGYDLPADAIPSPLTRAIGTALDLRQFFLQRCAEMLKNEAQLIDVIQYLGHDNDFYVGLYSDTPEEVVELPASYSAS